MSSAPKPRPATLDEYAHVADQGQAVELVAGEIVEKARPLPEHSRAQRKLGVVLDGFDDDPGGGPPRPGGWWIFTELGVLYPTTQEVFRHDLAGFRRDAHAAPPQGTPVRVRPDWVCEILSPSTARRDAGPKKATLHAHAVPHYWIADPANMLLTVFRWTQERYIPVVDAGLGDVVRAEPFDAIEIDVGRIFSVRAPE